ncbi:methyltransferase-like protein, partial [Angomonas deanei]
MSATRPEFENPPEIFYNATEAKKYTVSTRVQTIQREMTHRALELLNLPRPAPGHTDVNDSAYLLDIGCGSGISGAVLTEAGHAWVGVDISRDMLRIAKQEELAAYGIDEAEKKEEEEDFLRNRKKVDLSNVKWGLIESAEDEAEEAEEEEEEETTDPLKDLFPHHNVLDFPTEEVVEEPTRPEGPQMVEVAHSDMGDGLPFRPGTFDGCVSISAVQWLCHVSKKGQVPQRRLMSLFQSLYNCLRRGAKAVFQFYPSCPEQVHIITRAAMKCGFGGGVVVDYPNSARAKKYYLVLQAGQVSGGFVPPPGLTDDLAPSDEEEEEEEEMEEEEE